MEPDKLEKMYIEYAAQVYRYAMFLLGNKEQAEDVTAETFTRLLEKGMDSDVRNENAWVIGMARNIIFDKYKRKARVINLQTEVVDIEPDTDQGPEGVAVDAATTELVKEKLDQLDATSREVVALKIWQDYKFRDIAELLDLKENTVKSIYYRGLEQLKVMIGERKRGKKLYSMTLPLLVAAIGTVGRSQELLIAQSTAAGIASQLGLAANLVINTSNMTASATTVAATTTVKAGLLATTGAKVAAVAVTTTAVVAGGVGIAVVSNNQQPISTPVSVPISTATNPIVEQPDEQETGDYVWSLVRDLYDWGNDPVTTTLDWRNEDGAFSIDGWQIETTSSDYQEMLDLQNSIETTLQSSGFYESPYNQADGSGHRSGYQKNPWKVVLLFETGEEKMVRVQWASKLLENETEEVSVDLRENTQDSSQTDVYLVYSDHEQFFATLPDVRRDHYHPAEYAAGNVYVLKRTGNDTYLSEDWTDELWMYTSPGNGTKLYSDQGLDFRVAPDGSKIGVTTPIYLKTLKGDGTMVDIYYASDHLGLDELFSLEGWSKDSNVLWTAARAAARVGSFVAVDFINGLNTLDIYAVDGLSLGSEYDLNLNTGYLIYSDYPFIYDVDRQRRFDESGTEVHLYYADVKTGIQVQLTPTLVAKPFEPIWVTSVSDNLIEYNEVDGNRVWEILPI